MGNTQNQRIKYPFGEATVINDLQDLDTLAPAAIWNNLTIIKVPALGQNATLNLTLDSELEDGALLKIDMNQGATGRNLTLGTGFVGSGITGVANDKDTIEAVYDSVEAAFRVSSNFKSVDAA